MSPRAVQLGCAICSLSLRRPRAARDRRCAHTRRRERNGAMTGHSLARVRIWIVALVAIMLVAGHGIILYYASSHLALSAGLISGVVLLIVIKHLGLLGSAYALFRRRVMTGRKKQNGKG